MITRWIGKRCQIKFNLIYRGSSYNFNSEEFHIKFDDAVPTLVVIQSRSGARFGESTTQILKGENTYKNDYPVGVEKDYYKNEQLRYESFWKNERRSGWAKGYDKEGNLNYDTFYINGISGATRYYNKDGSLRKTDR